MDVLDGFFAVVIEEQGSGVNDNWVGVPPLPLLPPLPAIRSGPVVVGVLGVVVVGVLRMVREASSVEADTDAGSVWVRRLNGAATALGGDGDACGGGRGGGGGGGDEDTETPVDWSGNRMVLVVYMGAGGEDEEEDCTEGGVDALSAGREEG